jgi:hypothetical protein
MIFGNRYHTGMANIAVDDRASVWPRGRGRLTARARHGWQSESEMRSTANCMSLQVATGRAADPLLDETARASPSLQGPHSMSLRGAKRRSNLGHVEVWTRQHPPARDHSYPPGLARNKISPSPRGRGVEGGDVQTRPIWVRPLPLPQGGISAPIQRVSSGRGSAGPAGGNSQ